MENNTSLQQQLLEAGVHFGHLKKKWNPKMLPYIFAEKKGIHIIDLNKTVDCLQETAAALKQIARSGKKILFVGTKKQAQEAIAEQAKRVGMPYINQRWLGGLLTNFQTVQKRLARLKELEVMDFNDSSKSGLTKKELLILRREKDKLEKSLGGIRNVNKTPSAIWVVDTNKEHLAITEAKKLGIPVIGILDTNCDPDEVTIGIPGNDDAIRANDLMCRVIAEAALEGRHMASKKASVAAAQAAAAAVANAAAAVAAVGASVVEPKPIPAPPAAPTPGA